MKEIWYKIIDFKDVENNVYEISNKGRVRKIQSNGYRILKTHLCQRGGYPSVSLYSSKSQKTYYRTVHTLMKYFIFNCFDPTIMINHKNGDKTDYDINNLELSNALHNTHHAIDTGLFIAKKVTEDDINNLREFLLNNRHKYNYKELSEIFDLKILSAHRIIKGNIRKNRILEDLSALVETKENRLNRITPAIIEEFKHNNVYGVCKKFHIDYETARKIAQNIIREYSV